MRLLLDTHVLLWSMAQPERLADAAKAQLADAGNELHFSVICTWEIAIKRSIGKLSLAQNWLEQIETHCRNWGIASLPLNQGHCGSLAHLPLHHRDPFDRMLVAQAQYEGLDIVSADPALDAYGVKRVW